MIMKGMHVVISDTTKPEMLTHMWNPVRFKVLTAVVVKKSVFWDVTP
jgi:hypothetical protein